MNKQYKAIYMTAREMALTAHNLSADGMTARVSKESVFKWSDHFQVWAGPFPAEKDSPKAPRSKK